MSQITEKMVAVIRDLTHVAKNQRNTQQNFTFRGIDDLFNAIGPALREHGVFILPTVQDVVTEQVTNRSGGTGYRTIVTVAYQFLAEDGSGVSAMGRGEAIDWSDKSVSKAMQMALKYTLIQVFAIPTDEPDPDAETHEIAREPGIDEVRTALLDYANANSIPAPKLATEFAEQFGKPINQGSLDDLKTFYAKVRLGGQEVASDGA